MSGGQSRSKIVLDADDTRARGVAKGLGEEFKKTTKQAAGVGRELEQWGGKLAKTIASVGAVARSISAVSEEFRKLQREAGDANRTSGGAALDRGITAARLGISAQDAAALTAPGSRNAGEVDGFLNALLGTKVLGGPAPDRTQIFRATNLFRGGGFAQEEIIRALEEGRLGELEASAQGRIEALGGEAQDELALRGFENEQAARALEARAARGRSVRVGQAARDRRNAESPGSAVVQGVAGALTGPLGGDALIETADVALMSEQNAILQRIANNTAPRPALARPAGSE